MKFYGKSDVGMVRDENQDSFAITELLPGISLAVVCDGMGGYAGGSVASRLAVDTFTDMMRENLIPDSPEDRANLEPGFIKRALELSAKAANEAVWKKAHEREDGKFEGMGTTLVAVITVGNDCAYYVNVGDSRLYYISDAFMTQQSHDHSLVQELVDSGNISYEEAASSPIRNMITRAIGGGETVDPDVKTVDLGVPEDGRRFLLLCSDGLYVCVGAEHIAEIVLGDDEINVKVERLVKIARNNGGPDNITVILVEIAE